MASNTIAFTVELCSEDRARLDALLEVLRHDATLIGSIPAAEPAPVEKQPEEAPVAAQEPVSEAQAVTREMIQAKVVTLIQSGHKDEAAAIVKAVAKNVSSLPEDSLADVYAKLSALEVANA